MMRVYFGPCLAASFLLFSLESVAQGLPPAPPSPAPAPPPPLANPTAPNAAPAPPPLPSQPPAPTATPPTPGPAPAPPPAGTAPSGLEAPPPPPPSGPGQTMVPQGTPYPQPYPYPYYPQPYYNGQGYAPGWAPRPQPKMKTVWYGWQTMIGVVVGDVLTLAGGYSNTEGLIYAGVAGHILTGPIVHWTHGHVGKGFLALGLNVGAPLAGSGIGVLGAATGLGFYGALILGGIGYFVGPILDIALLSTEKVPDTTTTTAPKGARLLLPSSVSVVPMLDQNRRGLMLVGQF